MGKVFNSFFFATNMVQKIILTTPTEKLEEFKKMLEDFPLIVGAGVNLDNIHEQLRITDGP